MNKKWVNIFKALSNINRLKIIEMLLGGNKELTVTQIADKLGISIKSTSKHLIMLQNLDVLECEGRNGRVFYKFSQSVPQDFKSIIKLLFL
jgi:DNA-binding transcriptional ArsR family regulator